MTIMEFSEIKCRRLSIVDDRGRTHAVLQKSLERMSDTADVIQIYSDDRKIVYTAGFDPQGNGVMEDKQPPRKTSHHVWRGAREW